MRRRKNLWRLIQQAIYRKIIPVFLGIKFEILTWWFKIGKLDRKRPIMV